MSGENEEDIDRFLYGDEAEQVKQVAAETKSGSTDTKAAEAVEEEYSESSDDSDIEIVIDSSSKGNKDGANTGNSTQQSLEQQQASLAAMKIDINAEGELNGRSIYEYDLDGADDKPWMKPGADLTDFFNYGFNEWSWKSYCAKQRAMRAGISEQKQTNSGQSQGGGSKDHHAHRRGGAARRNLSPPPSKSQPPPPDGDNRRVSDERKYRHDARPRYTQGQTKSHQTKNISREREGERGSGRDRERYSSRDAASRESTFRERSREPYREGSSRERVVRQPRASRSPPPPHKHPPYKRRRN